MVMVNSQSFEKYVYLCKLFFNVAPASKLRRTICVIVDSKSCQRSFADIINCVNDKVHVPDATDKVCDPATGAKGPRQTNAPPEVSAKVSSGFCEMQLSSSTDSGIVYNTFKLPKRQLPLLDYVQQLAKKARQVPDNYKRLTHWKRPMSMKYDKAKQETLLWPRRTQHLQTAYDKSCLRQHIIA